MNRAGSYASIEAKIGVRADALTQSREPLPLLVAVNASVARAERRDRFVVFMQSSVVCVESTEGWGLCIPSIILDRAQINQSSGTARAPRVGYESGRSPHWIKIKNPDSRP
jgi:hypothetical protein